MTLSYDEHLAAVNTVTFIQNNKYFISTSDDKKIFYWEYGVPVVIKHVLEPDQQAITSACNHPNDKYYAGQAMNNRILVYDSKGGFKINRKKKFTGHSTTGYSCGIEFSPDG